MRPPFPPPELRLGETFPPGLGPRNGGALLAIWDFVNRFGDVLGLWPCTLDELLSAGERLSTARSLWQQPPFELMPVTACTLPTCPGCCLLVMGMHHSTCCPVLLVAGEFSSVRGLWVCTLDGYLLLGSCQLCRQPPPCQAEDIVQGCQHGQLCLLFGHLKQQMPQPAKVFMRMGSHHLPSRF